MCVCVSLYEYARRRILIITVPIKRRNFLFVLNECVYFADLIGWKTFILFVFVFVVVTTTAAAIAAVAIVFVVFFYIHFILIDSR